MRLSPSGLRRLQRVWCRFWKKGELDHPRKTTRHMDCWELLTTKYPPLTTENRYRSYTCKMLYLTAVRLYIFRLHRLDVADGFSRAAVRNITACPCFHEYRLGYLKKNAQQSKYSDSYRIIQVFDDAQRRKGSQLGGNQHLRSVRDDTLDDTRESIPGYLHSCVCPPCNG